MASNEKYRAVVPATIQQFEEDNGLYPADWYVPSAALPGVYLKRFEELFPSPPALQYDSHDDIEGCSLMPE